MCTRHLCQLLLLSAVSINSSAQPYIDIINLRYQHSPDITLLENNGIKNKFTYFNVSANIPYQLKDSSIIVFSPFADQWQVSLANDTNHGIDVQSVVIPLTYIKPLNSTLQLSTTIIPRFNGYRNALSGRNFQLGAAALLSQRKNNTLVFKYGLYFNNEFSGPFFMPLLGVDWQLNDKTNIFGVLPGHLTIERRVNKFLYYGALFRALTTSYHTNAPAYIRIDENQLAAWLDLYLTKGVVLNIEAGHSIYRRVRLGVENANPKYYFKNKLNDGIVLKASLAYRLRFRP